MKTKKAIFLVAQNCSGKTTIAQILADNLSARIYSLREIINEFALNRGFILQNRESFTDFSQKNKKLYGPEFFIKKALEDFSKIQDSFAIIESVRCPGEMIWLNNNKFFSGIQNIPIALIAPDSVRKERFYKRSTNENLSNQKSEEEFYKQEKLVNSGVEPWEENVKNTVLLTFNRFENADKNGPDSCIKHILSRIYSI